jgi:hypothetical protein
MMFGTENYRGDKCCRLQSFPGENDGCISSRQQQQQQHNGNIYGMNRTTHVAEVSLTGGLEVKSDLGQSLADEAEFIQQSPTVGNLLASGQASLTG